MRGLHRLRGLSAARLAAGPRLGGHPRGRGRGGGAGRQPGPDQDAGLHAGRRLRGPRWRHLRGLLGVGLPEHLQHRACPSTWWPSWSSAAWAASRASSSVPSCLIGLPELFREFSEYRFLFYGLALMLVMRFRPEGLLPSAVGKREMHADEDHVMAALPARTPTHGGLRHERAARGRGRHQALRRPGRRPTPWTSPSTRASSSASSGPTAPARRPSSTASPASTASTRAASCWAARPSTSCPRPDRPPGPARGRTRTSASSTA